MTYNFNYNGHLIAVERYRDYVGEDETDFFWAISVDGEYLDHGYLSLELARKAAEDFIDGDLKNL